LEGEIVSDDVFRRSEGVQRKSDPLKEVVRRKSKSKRKVYNKESTRSEGGDNERGESLSEPFVTTRGEKS